MKQIVRKKEVPGYVKAVQYLTFYIDPTNKVYSNYNHYARCSVCVQSVGPNVKLKYIGFPAAKRPNLSVREPLFCHVTSNPNAKTMTLISARIGPAKKQAATDFCIELPDRYWARIGLAKKGTCLAASLD